MRINKFLSNAGICSRKETNKLIEDKRIKVNNEYCVCGQWIDENDEILLDDRPIESLEKIYIAFNKPIGIICTTDRQKKDNIIDYINFKQYIFPVGRLDKESQGLILMTNDGDFANNVIHSDCNHEKEYVVTLDKEYNDDFIIMMQKGIKISAKESSNVKRINDYQGIRKVEEDGKNIFTIESLKSLNTRDRKNEVITKKCKVYRIDKKTFKIILTQGLNRQIRKMCKALGYNVVKLERIRIMNIELLDIGDGQYRYLTKEEVNYIKRNI